MDVWDADIEAMLRQMHSAVRINAYANMDAGMEGNGQRKRYAGEL